MSSQYVLRIVDRDTGQIVHQWEPGRAAEVELVSNYTKRLAAKKIGRLRSADQVVAEARDAFHELLRDLKASV